MLPTSVSNQDVPDPNGWCLYSADIMTGVALREHLLAQVHSPPSSHKLDILRVANPKSPRDQNIDPAIAGTGMMSRSAEESGGENDGLDGLDFKRPPKRELSSSKRAAQNRQAQVRWILFLRPVRSLLAIEQNLNLAKFG